MKAIGQPELGVYYGMKLAQEKWDKEKEKEKQEEEEEQKNAELAGEWLTQNLG
jgi:hypothetical protein